MIVGECSACSEVRPLVRHHWYDLEYAELPTSTAKWSPKELYIRGHLLFYHEQLICLKCNRLLTLNEIRYFKGGGIKPFKQSDDSHIMPVWETQLAFVKYKKQIELKYERSLNGKVGLQGA
jgi:hypothetical protein